eukprot:m.70185 g.70185  ORF g.70185 m.70185 type:complete len:355 (+) comp12879_c0_seq2:78-1142(+)
MAVDSEKSPPKRSCWRTCGFLFACLATVLVVLLVVWAQYPLRCQCDLQYPLVPFSSHPIADLDFSGPRINHYQLFGTHNSYHQRSWLPVPPWQYSHKPIATQLDQGARTIEFDVHFGHGKWVVFHLPILDDHSSVNCLRDAFGQVRAWSEAHPCHFPLTIILEPKYLLDLHHWCTRAVLESLETLLLESFPREMLITPADIQGNYSSLRQAIEARGWPSVASARGKVLFEFDFWNENRLCRDAFDQVPLTSRLLFERRMGDIASDASIVELASDDPATITALAREHFLVRSYIGSINQNPDATREAWDTALAAGMHLIATDQWDASPRAIRCNPVTAGPDCQATLATLETCPES